MDRVTYSALLGQYSVQDLVLDGGVGWDRSVHCVLPRLEVRGGTVQETPSPTSPVEPQFVEAGTKLFVRSGNLLDISTALYGKRLYGNGNTIPIMPTTDEPSSVTFRAEIPAGKPYTLTINNAASKLRRMVANDENNLSLQGWNWYSFSQEQGPTIQFTPPEGTAYLWFEIEKKDGSQMLPEDVAVAAPRFVPGTYTDADVPAYEPYFDGGTVTVPEQMIAVPGTDYYDSLDALTGSGKHRFYKITLDGVTQHKKFTELHNTNPADVFVVTMGNIHGSGDTPSALNSVTAMVCNYFPYDNSWYGNKVGAFQYGNGTYGLVAKFPYALFGVAKGEKTNDELIALANTWLAERYEAGEPLYYYYVMAEDEPFSTAPSGRLIQPRGTCNIVQSGTGADAAAAVQCVRHW